MARHDASSYDSMPLVWSYRPRRHAVRRQARGLLLLALLLPHLVAPHAAAAQTTWTTPRTCDLTWGFNITLSYNYDTQTYWEYGIPFYHGTGNLDMSAYYNGASNGTYWFGDIVTGDRRFQLRGAHIEGSCITVNTHLTGAQYLLTSPLVLNTGNGGTVVRLFTAEENEGGTGGGGQGDNMCLYLVLADDNGNPILDSNGNYIIIEELGCEQMAE